MYFENDKSTLGDINAKKREQPFNLFSKQNV